MSYQAACLEIAGCTYDDGKKQGTYLTCILLAGLGGKAVECKPSHPVPVGSVVLRNMYESILPRRCEVPSAFEALIKLRLCKDRVGFSVTQ